MTATAPPLAALNRDPMDPNKILAVANLLNAGDNHAIAFHLLERAATIVEHPEILRVQALTMLMLAPFTGDENYITAAEGVLIRALELAPDSPDLQKALGACALQLGRYEEAERLSLMALAAKPDQHDAQHTLAVCAFFKQRWGEAFDLYEKHIGKPPLLRKLPAKPEGPYWDGRPGTRLLVVGEQGIGDEISFASMVNDAARDNEVTLWCDARLEMLFRRSMPSVRVEGRRHIGPDTMYFSSLDYESFDARCLSGSLGRYYRRNASDFPRTGFLTADPDMRAAMRARLAQLPGKKVGIAWTGGKAPSYWHRRGLPQDDLYALTRIPGVTWVSLQYDSPDPETLKTCGIHHFIDVLEGGGSYDRTAALVMELDAVVTVTTAVAHLAGALGKRAHVLTNEIPRWFYGVEGSSHAWYDALALHRQKDGLWPIGEVMAAVEKEIA